MGKYVVSSGNWSYSFDSDEELTAGDAAAKALLKINEFKTIDGEPPTIAPLCSVVCPDASEKIVASSVVLEIAGEKDLSKKMLELMEI